MKIRPHHLLCIPRFKGGGYNKKIREKIFSIQKRVKENPDLKIEIVKNNDDVCKACPFMQGNKCVKRPDINGKIKLQDETVLAKLGITEKNWKAKDIFNLSVNKIGDKELEKICQGCEFLDYCIKDGINKSFIDKLKK